MDLTKNPYGAWCEGHQDITDFRFAVRDEYKRLGGEALLPSPGPSGDRRPTIMRFWFDTEFIEDGKTIDLISIGIVADDGTWYYAENRDCDHSRASPWVREIHEVSVWHGR